LIKFVTTNDGKFKEVSEMFAAKGIELARLNQSYPEIQADSVGEVVEYGLKTIPAEEGDLLIDDSGLFIEKLGGFPGVYSSFVYKTLGCQGILKLMMGWTARGARFETCFGLRVSGETHIFHGKCEGVISTEMRGNSGFGYDPIFIPKGQRKTFAQMTVKEKNDFSHRGKAARLAVKFLLKESGDE
jgi:XTP/dITP diphosphohydrolase